MRIWIFPELDQCTTEYHPEGGLVVIANNEEQAREVVKNETDAVIPNWNDADTYEITGDHTPRAYIYPNAGCC